MARSSEFTALEVRHRLDAGEGLVEIAADLGRLPGELRRALRVAGLPVPPWRPPRPVLDPAALRAWYVGQGWSISQIAARSGYSRGTVAVALRAARIPLRGRYEHPRSPTQPVISVDQLTDLYLERGFTARQAADELGCEPSAVRAALKLHSIRRPVVSPALEVDRDTLTRLYVVERLDDRTIAARYGVPTRHVTRRRRELNVHRHRIPPAGRTSPPPPAAADLHQLFVEHTLPIQAIAERHHTSPRVVRGWLTDAGYRLYPRGDRRQRPTTQPDPVLSALYADPEVVALLRRHQIPWPPMAAGGDITNRPAIAVTRPFLQQAYQHIGLSIEHIAMLTGRSRDHLQRALQASGIPTNTDPYFSPWAARLARRRARLKVRN